MKAPALVTVVLLLLLCRANEAPAQSPTHAEHIKAQLRAFAHEQFRARRDKDRAALERLYADEFVFVHAFGYVDDKQTVIREAMEETQPPRLFLPTFEPPEAFHLTDELAIVRHARGRTGMDTPAMGTWIFVHRDGRWQLLQVQSTELAVLAPEIPLDPAAMSAYVGTYRTPDNQDVRVERRVDGLYVTGARFPARKLIPIRTDAFTTILGNELEFRRGADGRVVGYTSTFRRLRETKAERVE